MTAFDFSYLSDKYSFFLCLGYSEKFKFKDTILTSI